MPTREQLASAALARVDALHSGLTHIAVEGGDLNGIAAEVARVLDVGVFFTSSDGRERAASASAQVRAAMEEYQLLDETGRIRVERIGRDGAPVGESGVVRLLPVAAGGADLARLVCVRTDGEIDADDVHAMERAAAVAALLITHQNAVTAVENKYQGDFLRDLFQRRAGDPDYISEHVETFGWKLDRPMVVVTAEIDPPGPDDEPTARSTRRLWQDRFSAAWRQVTRGIDPSIPCVDFSSEVVALLPVEDPDEDPIPGQRVVDHCVTAVSGDRGGGRRPFSVGIGRVAHSIEELPQSYAQARRAVEVGRRVRGGRSTTFFDQLGLHRLIALIPDPAELGGFVRDVLGPLAEGTSEAEDLRTSLQVLLDTNFNVAEAARAQYFHYNTMRYRLAKLERLLGPVASDPHLRLDAAVALRVLEIVEPPL